MARPLGSERILRRSRRLTNGDMCVLADMYREGHTVEEISVRLLIHRTTVLRHLDHLGVETRWRKLDDEAIAQCVGRYLSGETCREIARDHGVHPDTMRRRLVAAGVKMRVGRFGGV